jgi:uncharacterized protein
VTEVRISDVPCNGCTACCRSGEMVILQSECGDVVSRYQTQVMYHGAIPIVVLKRKSDGSCVYLGENGCTIHDWAPAQCKAFDCRELVQRLDKIPRAQRIMMRRKGFKFNKEVEAAGRLRLQTLVEEAARWPSAT